MEPNNSGSGQPVTSHNALTPKVTPPDHRLPDHGTPDLVKPTFGGLTFNVPDAPAPVMPTSTASTDIPDDDFTPLPPKEATISTLTARPDDRPVPVVKVLSIRGVEYAMMSIFLWFAASSLIWLLVSLIMGNNSFNMLAFPISVLLVSMPGFAWLYIRLRKAELVDPSLRFEASKRRFSQITQIVAFLTCLSNLIALVYAVVSKIGGAGGVSIGKTIGSTLVVLVIAGGILAYYWHDEHKSFRK